MSRFHLYKEFPHSQQKTPSGEEANLISVGEWDPKRDWWCASPNKRHVLVFQADGNLCLYELEANSEPKERTYVNGTPVWQTGTADVKAQKLSFSQDGNLVVYSEGSKVLWESGTRVGKPLGLFVLNYGRVVIYADNYPAWGKEKNTSAPSENVTLGKEIAHVKMSNVSAIKPDAVWRREESWWCASPNQKHVLVFRGSGNLCLYDLASNSSALKPNVIVPGTPVWCTGTDNDRGQQVAYDQNGNLVVYDRDSKVLWQSGTGQGKPIGLYVQDDGNLVIYADSYPAWSAGTAIARTLHLGKEMAHEKTSNVSIIKPNNDWPRGSDAWCASPNRKHVLIFRFDGNLCLYHLDSNSQPQSNSYVFGDAAWSTGTKGKGQKLGFQADGNLVVYGEDSNVLWASGTDHGKPIGLYVQDDGNVAIYADNYPAWVKPYTSKEPATDLSEIAYLGEEIAHEQKGGANVIKPGTEWRHKGWCASPNKQCVLLFIVGELAFYGLNPNQLAGPNKSPTGSIRWVAGTYAHGETVKYKADGNLVIHGNGEVQWESRTGQGKPIGLYVQDDGNVMLIADNYPAWATHTKV